jgi:hypothetical protein
MGSLLGPVDASLMILILSINQLSPSSEADRLRCHVSFQMEQFADAKLVHSHLL